MACTWMRWGATGYLYDLEGLVQHPSPQQIPHRPQHLVRQRTKTRMAVTMIDAPMMTHLKIGTDFLVVLLAGGGGG